nr:SusC/RagA family TonB-linked outer membrane protein [Odoribacter splanchnicus]
MKNRSYYRTYWCRWLCSVVYVLLLGSSFAHASVAQQLTKVNLSRQNAEVRDILKEIKAQTAFDFVYNAREIDDRMKISVDIRDAGLDAALRICLEGLDIDFVIQDKIIVLQKRKTLQQMQPKVLILKGIVRDSGGQPLPGVSVLLKGTALGVATDTEGRFSISIPAEEKLPELLFSFIGMKTESFQVKDPAKEIRLVMHENSETLNEVIVTGMETVKKEYMTGSAAVITAKDLRMQGITSIDRILEGMVAGLNSTTISGAPGSRSKITIRGENNLSGNTEPLWIVDGLPMMSGVPQDNSGDYAGTIMQDGVGNIMPEDIESITILKDASAAAIYGARAANGVIVITTKKGFRSKTRVNYSGSYECGIAPRNHLDFMNSAEKLSYERSVIDYFGLDYAYLTGRGGYMYKRSVNGYLTPENYEREIQRLAKINTDWFDVLFRTAQSHSHNISLRGGTDELTYYTSVNYQEKNGILISNKYQSAGLLMKLDYRPVKNLIVALNVSANSRKNRDNASAIDPFTYAMFANPYERPYDDEGNYAADLSYLSNNYTSERASGYVYDQFNILKEMRDTRKKQDGSDVELTLDLRYEVIPGLSLESIVRKGISYNTETREVDAGTYTSWKNETFGRNAFKNYNIMPSGYDNGELSENSGKNYNWSIRNQIDYSFTVKKDHLFSVLLANEVMSKKFTNFGYTSPIYYDDYRITGVPTFDKNVSYEDLLSSVGGMFYTSDGQDRSVSFLGSLRYGYKDRYILNFNYRADGADVIGNTNRFTPLWSVGARYNLHNEKFFKNPVITELALRGSYGFTGNIDRSAYPFSTISFGSNMYLGDRYATNFTYPNPTVGWEKKQDRNIGLDLTLWDNRIHFTFDYYNNRTEDVLEDLEVPSSTGRTSVKANGGIVENSGMEFYLNVGWVKSGDFTFSTSFNIARNKNVIKKSYYDYASYQEAIKYSVVQGGIINIVGKETGGIYGWKFAGVNPDTGNPQYFLTEEGKRAYGKFLDAWDSYTEKQKERYQALVASMNEIPEKVDYLRGSDEKFGFMTSSMQYLGRSNPKYVGGFNTVMRYKGLEFSTSWTFKTGHLIPNFNDYQNAPNNEASDARAALGYSSDLKVSATNREKKYLYYWQFAGDETDVPRFTTSDNDLWASMCTSDHYSKGNYLRMTNLSVSYRFPSQLIQKWGMSNLSVGFNARNLLTFTKYRGLDVGSGDAFSYPVAREFNFKLTVGF